jgi:hypothetical protein
MAPRKPPKSPETLHERIKTLFTSPLGKLLLEDLNRLYNDRSSFNSDPLIMARNEGERNVVRMFNSYTNNPIMEDVELDGPGS